MKMGKDTSSFVQGCQSCVMNKPSSRSDYQGNQLFAPAEGRNSRVHIDHWGPVDSKWVLVMHDSFSKFTLIDIVDSTASHPNILSLRRTWVQVFGSPRVIISDNGTCFTSNTWKEAMELMGIDHRTGPPRRPQVNGAVEKMVGILKTKVRCNIGRGDLIGRIGSLE